jgi:ribonuclease M5
LIKVKEAIIVEGKYDKIKLSSVIDGLIIETHGFRIFRDKERMDFIRRLADTRGILILTDSDGAGFLIRNYLTGSIAPEKIKHAYIPDILGKERRKQKPSKEGKLGVEGVPVKTIVEALNRAGVVCGDVEAPAGRKITKTDLYLAGLSGGENSTQKRQKLLKELSLPEHLAPNSLVGVLNSIMSYEEFQLLLDKLFK